MFSEWTDPSDIDNYYDDLEHLLQDISTPSIMYSKSSPLKQMIIATPEAPTQQIIMQPSGSTINTTPPLKSTFLPFPQMEPSEPIDNQTEGVCKGYTLSLIPDNWWIYAMIFIIFLFLVVMILHQRSQLHAAQMTLRMLIAMYSNVMNNK